jgi:hypothetical protein
VSGPPGRRFGNTPASGTPAKGSMLGALGGMDWLLFARPALSLTIATAFRKTSILRLSVGGEGGDGDVWLRYLHPVLGRFLQDEYFKSGECLPLPSPYRDRSWLWNVDPRRGMELVQGSPATMSTPRFFLLKIEAPN